MNTAHILLAEDDKADQRLIRRALKSARLLNTLDIVEDGEQALAYLRREPPFEDARVPDLILLDLNMPRMDGKEFLQNLRADPALKHHVVVVLTTSKQEAEILRTYQLGANSYVIKPPTLEQLAELIRQLDGYWFQIVRLPNE